MNYGDGLVPLDKLFGTWHDGTPDGDARMNARYEKRRARPTRSKPPAEGATMSHWSKPAASTTSSSRASSATIRRRTFAVYRSPDGEFYCTDGLCTHESVHLADGFVMDYEIECPSTRATSTIVPA